MNLSLTALTHSFYFAAACCGIPSFAGTLLVFIYRIYGLITPEPSKFVNAKNPDAILLMLGGIAGFIEKLASAFSFLGRFVMSGMAVISVTGLLMSWVLFLTARGLQAHRPWALTLAAIIVGVTLGVAGLSFLATRGLLRIGALAVMIACVFALVSVRRDWQIQSAPQVIGQ